MAPSHASELFDEMCGNAVVNLKNPGILFFSDLNVEIETKFGFEFCLKKKKL